LSKRRSCRSFIDREPPEGLVLDLIDKARRTPTAGNSQGVEFLLLDEKSLIDDFWGVSFSEKDRSGFSFPGLFKAPALIIPFGVPSLYTDRYKENDKSYTNLGGDKKDWKVPYWLTDAAFATMALQLLAIEVELETCFIGLFDREERIKEHFSIPESYEALGVLIMGYPDTQKVTLGRSQKRKRRPLNEVVHRGVGDFRCEKF
jgi:nitroreductase|tara:strand:- start:1684 stop:2292 length:609 start_codon:yes stop_codon:yes gene_type:complete